MNNTAFLVIEPGEEPCIVRHALTLPYMQKTVGGYIEAVYPFDDPVAIVCNDDGKNNGSRPNRALWYKRKIYDIIFGTFLIVGLDREDFAGMPDALLMKYRELFRTPEFFAKIGGHLVMLKNDEADQLNMKGR